MLDLKVASKTRNAGFSKFFSNRQPSYLQFKLSVLFSPTIRNLPLNINYNATYLIILFEV